MGLPAGCEIVAHYIRSQLESNPSLVIAKVDVKNAFNEIDPAAILSVISEHLPEVLPFADLLLAQSSMQVIFHDPRGGHTSVHKMEKGVPQGGSTSGALFNMGQSTSIRRAAQLHPAVSILLIADDTHVLGTPEEVIAAIMTIRDLYAEIGLSLAATTASKNVTPQYVLSTYCMSLRPFHSCLRLLFTIHSVQYTQYTVCSLILL